MDSLATMTSIALQYGVPLRDLVNKFAHMRFEPAGFTGNAEIPIAKSIVDYVFRWMGSRFLSKDERDALGIIVRDDTLGGGRVSLRNPVPFGGWRRQPGCYGVGSHRAASVNAALPPGRCFQRGRRREQLLSRPSGDEWWKATAVATRSASGGDDGELPVLSNGHGNGNGHTNGHDKTTLSPIKPIDLGGGHEGRASA